MNPMAASRFFIQATSWGISVSDGDDSSCRIGEGLFAEIKELLQARPESLLMGRMAPLQRGSSGMW